MSAVKSIALPRLTEAEIVAFWQRVDRSDPDGCWLRARGTRVTKGRTQVKIRGVMYVAARIAWMLTHGRITHGLHVLHTCDNPGCVNPDHLFLGTQEDNVRDMIRKGRARPRRGTSNGNAKLTEDQVRYVRQRAGTFATTHESLARELGVSVNTVSLIVQRKTWAHLD